MSIFISQMWTIVTQTRAFTENVKMEKSPIRVYVVKVLTLFWSV